MAEIINGAPQVVLLGIDDRSRRPMPRSIALRPTHYPLVMFFGQRGPAVPRPMLNGDQSIYGADTFNPIKKWFNHATPFLSGFLGEGNAVMAQRVVPDDAPPPAAARYSIEILKTTKEIWDRNEDGSFKLVNGQRVPLGIQIDGYNARFLITDIPNDDVNDFGKGTITEGVLEDPITHVKSEVIPLWDIRESSQGADGNLTCYNVFAPTRSDRDVAFDFRLINQMRSYPLVFRLGRRATPTSSPVTQRTLTGGTSVVMTLQDGDAVPSTNQPMHMVDRLVPSYNRFDDSQRPDVYGYVDSVAVYQDNIDRICKMLYDAERAYVETKPALLVNYDFNFDGVHETHVMNFLGGKTSMDYPYNAYEIVDTAPAYNPGRVMWVDLRGGGDGTMNNDVFGELVTREIQRYADNFDVKKQDDARRVESIFYDSGFDIDDKFKLLDFLGVRKDLAVALSTFVHDDGKIDASEEYARASALRARAQLYVESVEFGTPVTRVCIWGRSGKLIGSNYRRRVPGTYEFAMKSAKFMGSGNRVWRSDLQPTGYPNHIVEYLTDVNIGFTSVDQRIDDWNVGLNWIQNFDQNSMYLPAYKSVYPDDTSVLTSWFTVMAIVEIEKTVMLVQRMFSGVDNLTNEQFAERVDREIARQLQSVFGGRYRLEVETQFTDEDVARNFSYHTIVRIGATGMKTVMVAKVESYRFEDLAPSV